MKIIKNLITAFAATSILLGSSFADHHKKKDIVDTAVSNGNFKTLAAALTAGGLIETLKGKGPFTRKSNTKKHNHLRTQWNPYIS